MNAPLAHDRGKSPDVADDAESAFLAPHEIAVEFFESTKRLDDHQRQWLASRGISDMAIRGDPSYDTAELRMGCVTFDRSYFDFAGREDEGARPALVVIARNEFGTVDDMVAFDACGAIGAWLGRAAMLGEQMRYFPRIESPALPVYPDSLSWLKADRRGVVVIDPTRAGWRLAGESLVVADAAFGRRLRDMLRLPDPKVFVTRRAA